MVGASDGRIYKGQSRFGVSVFEFRVSRLGAKSDDKSGPAFVGYGRIPGLPDSRFLLWSHINDIRATYDSIDIDTSSQEDLHYQLRENLDFGQLEQIHEFCRHYLGKVSG